MRVRKGLNSRKVRSYPIGKSLNIPVTSVSGSKTFGDVQGSSLEGLSSISWTICQYEFLTMNWLVKPTFFKSKIWTP